MVTQHAAIKLVSDFANDVKKQGVHLQKVFLFGSYAHNRQREESDIDVALVADEFTGVGYDDMKLFVKSLRNYTIIQPQTYSTRHFNQGDPFIEEISKSGIEIKLQ